jgi:hypothetical protein
MARQGDQPCDIASMPRFGKQSQFLDCGFWPPVAAGGDNIADWGPPCGGTVHCAKQTQFPAARMATGAGFCQTKPICPGRSGPGRPIVRNKAKLGKTGAGGQRRSWYGGRVRRKVEFAKQSQFRLCRGNETPLFALFILRPWLHLGFLCAFLRSWFGVD